MNKRMSYLNIRKPWNQVYYGLTPMCVRRIVYKYCKENGIPHSFDTKAQMAGRKWFQKFMARHKELSIRTPEPVSI